jgi:hypothetical protein
MAVDSLDDARSCLAEALLHLHESGQVWTITALEHHAVYCGLRGDVEGAATLLGFTDARLAAAGTTRKSTERYGFTRLEALLRNAYGREELERRFAVGKALTREQALDRAAEIHRANG